jgi:ribosomal protein S18 acetylase RimI-like enzyme
VDHPPCIAGHIVRVLTDADAGELDELHRRCADFVQLVEGRAPAGGDGLSVLRDRPEDASPEIKLTLGVYDGPRMVAVADLMRGYPSPDVWYIGLLLLAPETRRRGLGAAMLAAIAELARSNGASSLRIAVQSQNERGLTFWRRHGFVELKRVQQQNGALLNIVLVMGRRLVP